MINSFRRLIGLAVVLALAPPAHSGPHVLSIHSTQTIIEPNPAIIRVVTYDDVARTLKELEAQYAKVQQQFGNDPTKAPLLKAMAEQIQALKETLRVSQEAEEQTAQKQQQEQSKVSDQATKREQVNQLNAKIEELRKQQAAQQVIEQQQKDAQEAAKQEQVKQLNAKIEELRKQQAVQQAAEQSAKDAQAQEAARQDELNKKQATQQQEDQTSQQAVRDAKVRELTQKIEALRKLQASQQAIEDQKKQAAEQAAKTSEQQQLNTNFGAADGQQSGVQIDTTTANSTPQTMPNQPDSNLKNLRDLKARLDVLVNKKKSQGTALSVNTAGTPANSAASNTQANLEILKKKVASGVAIAASQTQTPKIQASNFVLYGDKSYDGTSIGTIAGTLGFRSSLGTQIMLNSFNSGPSYGKSNQGNAFQCVEMIHRYLLALGEVNPSGLGNGRSVAYNVSKLDPHMFQFVPNGTPNTKLLPRAGAIISVGSIYGKSGQIEEEGHVGIVAEPGIFSADRQSYYAKLFDQNWPSKQWGVVEFRNFNGTWVGTMPDSNAVNNGVAIVGWANLNL